MALGGSSRVGRRERGAGGDPARQEGIEADAVTAVPPPKTAEMVGATDSAGTPAKGAQEPSATS